MKKFYVFLFTCLLTISFTAIPSCSDDDKPSTPSGPVPVKQSNSPLANATDVALDASVTVTFDNDITLTNNGSITISDASGVSASATNNTLTIAHAAFEYGKEYTVNIPTIAITNLAEAITWKFTTVADNTPVPDDPVFSTTLTLGSTAYTIDSTYTEKVEDGLWYTYAQIKNDACPQIIHSVRLNAKSTKHRVESWIANEKLGGTGESPIDMVERKQTDQNKDVAVAINGGFYAVNTHVPVSFAMYNDLIVHSQFKSLGTSEFMENTPIIGFDLQNTPYMDWVYVDATVVDKNDTKAQITSINDRRWADDLVLYNSYFWADSTRTNEWGTEALLAPINGEWEKFASHKNVKCKVEQVSTYSVDRSMPIPKGKLVLSGNGPASDYVANLQVGDQVTVSTQIKLESDEEQRIRYAVAGWNFILQNDEVQAEAGWDDAAAILIPRNPRTSVGYSTDKEYIYYTIVEGRRPGIAAGVSTSELGQIMKWLGAGNAINLDGGGSSALVVNGELKNHPQDDGNVRRVVDGLAIIRK
ncbi:hypothetical protein FACS1894199_10640 [Bacteroidia bacterium]|nr:hypothetical protein FACS1894199_10640 [Bacteroidia bacterium]